MNLLHIMQCANLGGMEQTTLIRIRGLMQRGNQCRLVSLNPIGPLGPLLEEANVPAVGLPYRGTAGWRSFRSMYRNFRSHPADAVMMTGHNLTAILALGDLCPARRLLCIHYHHTGVKPEWQWRLIYRLAVARFNAITFPTDFVRREAEQIYPPLAAVSRTLRNPFPIPELPSAAEKAAARDALGIPPGCKVIGNAGWLIERKRFDVFLRVAERVAVRCPGAVFLIAGDGPQRAELETLARELGIAGRVRWLGWTRGLERFYAALDVLLFNSDWDALGRTPLEALAAGVPVVASVVHGGLDEIIDSTACGFLTNRHDVEWLADKVMTFLENPALASRTALAGRDRLASMSSPEQDTEALCRLLRIA